MYNVFALLSATGIDRAVIQMMMKMPRGSLSPMQAMGQTFLIIGGHRFVKEQLA